MMKLMASVISIEHVSITLGGRFQALKDITIDLAPGRITGFIGPSGAGKTTLIRGIVGRQKLSNGKMTVLGQPAGSARLRSRLRYMTQELSIYADLTAQENLRYLARMGGYKGGQANKLAADALAAVHMSDKAGVLVSSLSGGQKQRVSLAGALIGDAELLVLDEPTVGLDPVLREELWALFRKLRANGVTIIISSHVMDEAERCDDLLLIRDGRLVAHGTPDELRKRTSSKTVEQSFLKLAGGKQ
jgi:ABC-2 type transport system ATP-binding protein